MKKNATLTIFGMNPIDAKLLSENLPHEANLQIVSEESSGLGHQHDLGMSIAVFVLGTTAIAGVVSWLLKDRTEESTEMKMSLEYPDGLVLNLEFSHKELSSSTPEQLAAHMEAILKGVSQLSKV